MARRFLCICSLSVCFLVIPAFAARIESIFYEFGDNLGSHVSQRLLGHLGKLGISLQPVSALSSVVTPAAGSLVLSLGNASLSLRHASLPPDLPPESFRLVLRMPDSQLSLPLLASNGLPLDPHTHTNASFDKSRVSYGAVVGAYASLELLGFAFLHPLQPHTPDVLSLEHMCASPHAQSRSSALINKRKQTIHTKNDKTPTLAGGAFEGCNLDTTESPYWPERGWHLHTQHPLELTEVLQGHDIPQFGPHGPDCMAFTNNRGGRARARARAGAGGGQGLEGQTTARDTPPAPSFSSSPNRGATTAGYCERWEDMVAGEYKAPLCNWGVVGVGL